MRSIVHGYFSSDYYATAAAGYLFSLGIVRSGHHYLGDRFLINGHLTVTSLIIAHASQSGSTRRG